MNIRQLLFSPQGRTSRLTYWITIILVAVILAAVSLVVRKVLPGGGLHHANQPVAHLPPAQLGKVLAVAAAVFIILLPMLWVAIVIHVKRWHDLNYTGWMTLLSVVPYLGMAINLIVLGFIPGTKGPNRFGPA